LREELDGERGELLGHGGDVEDRRGRDRDAVFQVRHAVATLVDDLAVLHDGERASRRPGLVPGGKQPVRLRRQTRRVDVLPARLSVVGRGVRRLPQGENRLRGANPTQNKCQGKTATERAVWTREMHRSPPFRRPGCGTDLTSARSLSWPRGTASTRGVL